MTTLSPILQNSSSSCAWNRPGRVKVLLSFGTKKKRSTCTVTVFWLTPALITVPNSSLPDGARGTWPVLIGFNMFQIVDIRCKGVKNSKNMASVSGQYVATWKGLPAIQQPEYTDLQAVQAVTSQMKDLPPVVSTYEVDHLKLELAKVQSGEQLYLQVGDCAESFADCNSVVLEQKLHAYDIYRRVLEQYTQSPVVLIGRMAGQFAKPRSENYEMVDGTRVLAYRGDIVNSIDPSYREADPLRMLEGYYRSSATLNYIRQFYSPCQSRLYVSHEALLLPYEESLTRKVEKRTYNLGGHLIWLGERTRKLGSAHLTYLAECSNPVGIKVGPGTDLRELPEILRLINPRNESGKLVIIPRLGVNNVREKLPAIARCIKATNINHIWVSDPMHGNTYKTPEGFKTRRFDDILTEIALVSEVLQQEGLRLNGLHLEASWDNVTECVGGHAGIGHENLGEHYTSLCDPRLNFSQTCELLHKIAPALSRRY